jgi:hypothetical protein
MIKKVNKRAQELSTNAIVLIVLAVIVLVLLIFGFTRGWDSIAPWLSSSNVDKVVQACNVACATGRNYDYCNISREVKFEKDSIYKNRAYKCIDLEDKIAGLSECSNINKDLCSSSLTALEPKEATQ